MSQKPGVGVWRSVGRLFNLQAKELLWPEVTVGFVLGFGGAVVITATTHLAGRLSLVGGLVPLAAGFLAVVFAGLALVVSIPSQNYMRAMAETSGGGTLRFLDPFLIAVGTQTGILLLSIAYKTEAVHVPAVAEHVSFYVLSFLFVFGIVDIVALARQLVRHGVARGVEAMAAGDNNGDDQNDGGLRHLDDKRRRG